MEDLQVLQDLLQSDTGQMYLPLDLTRKLLNWIWCNSIKEGANFDTANKTTINLEFKLKIQKENPFSFGNIETDISEQVIW